MKIIFMGTPEFSVPILEELNKKYDVVLVVSQPDKLVGRKKILTHPPVVSKAIELGIKYFQPLKLKDEYEEVLNTDADMIVTAAFGQIVPDVILNKFKHSINVHASLLPKYRGGAPIQRSIIAGDKKTGVSIIEMVSKLDAGVIYSQREIDILDSDNNKTMFEKLSYLGKDLLMDTIEDIYNEKNKGIPQNEDEVIYSPNIRRDEELIDFNDSSINIFNKIRGLAEEPGAYASIGDNIIKVYSSKIIDDNSNKEPGTVLSVTKELIIKTKDGAISLIDIKPVGKNMMKARDFLNGQKIISLGDKFN